MVKSEYKCYIGGQRYATEKQKEKTKRKKKSYIGIRPSATKKQEKKGI